MTQLKLINKVMTQFGQSPPEATRVLRPPGIRCFRDLQAPPEFFLLRRGFSACCAAILHQHHSRARVIEGLDHDLGGIGLVTPRVTTTALVRIFLERTGIHGRRWLNIPNADTEAAAQVSFVDAYGEYEQHKNTLAMMEERLRFPFAAEVMGARVCVTGMAWPVVDEFGLDLVVAGPDGADHCIAVQSVTPKQPYPDGVEFLAL